MTTRFAAINHLIRQNADPEQVAMATAIMENSAIPILTYIIQYQRLPLVWTNYTDDNGDNVEFVTKSGAMTVAKDLAASSEVHPSQKESWKILDSHGNTFPLE